MSAIKRMTRGIHLQSTPVSAWITMLIIVSLCGSSHAGSGGASIDDLTEMSIEDLMNIEVTSVSRKAESLSDAAAAVYVITNEDIRRSGATSIAEALRMAPGMQVARIFSNDWAISARGFAQQYSNKMLVLIDGRSVYTPSFSGVYWDQQDLVLEDIDRIEVVRGPGAALWGSNAVNGVINIITRNSADTQGTYISGGGGNEELVFSEGRYGGRLGERTTYSIYGKYFDRDRSVLESGEEAIDGGDYLRGGFRVDHNNGENRLMITGGAYEGSVEAEIPTIHFTPPYSGELRGDKLPTGANLLTRFDRQCECGSQIGIQMYFDHTDYDDLPLHEVRNTFDFELQHGLSPLGRHELLWGVSYRVTSDDFEGSSRIFLDPAKRTYHLYGAFAQDKIQIIHERFWLTIGSKFEKNEYTGIEIQPSSHVLWKPHEKHTAWAAISHAVRIPSRLEDDVRINTVMIPPMPPYSEIPTQIAWIGDESLESEELVAWEAGYRWQATPVLSFDLSIFRNEYDKLASYTAETPFPVMGSETPHMVMPMKKTNDMNAVAQGTELAVMWWPAGWWRVYGAYSYLDIDSDMDGDHTDTTSMGKLELYPKHTASVRSLWDLPNNIQFDLMAYYVDRLREGDVPDYTRLDARIGWRPAANIELSAVFQNILDDQHAEFSETGATYSLSEVEQSIYGKVTLRF